MANAKNVKAAVAPITVPASSGQQQGVLPDDAAAVVEVEGGVEDYDYEGNGK